MSSLFLTNYTNSFENLVSTNCSNNTKRFKWLLEMSEINPGQSAILGGNKIIFYGIHYTAIVFILISLVACTSVIFSVFRNSKNRQNWDFSDRFPLYLAVSDFLWGLSNLSGDHVILVIRQIFPEKHVATIFAMNVFLFFGYQQLMSAGLSLYTYLKVVRRVSLDLGAWEWKLHAVVVTFLISNAVLYWYTEALGNSGFWFLADMNEKWGKLMGVNICITGTIHALLTLTAYRSIQNVINNQKRVVSTHIRPLTSSFGPEESKSTNGVAQPKKSKSKKAVRRNNSDLGQQDKYHTTATSCLTTFIYISVCLYFPFAITAWVYVGFGLFGLIEPTTALIAVIAANSGGWVNSVGYFHNRKLKEMRKQNLLAHNAKSNLLSISSSSV